MIYPMNALFWPLFILVFLPISKTDYVLYEVTAFNPQERGLLYSLQFKIPLITFLNGVSNDAAIPMKVIVKQELSIMFEANLRSLDIQYKRVTEVKSEQLNQLRNTTLPTNISQAFYDWDEILNWVESKRSRKFKKIVVAKTYEKRDIFFLKMTKNMKNPIVFIVGGEDGMDWLSSAVILNLFDDMLDDRDELKVLQDNFNFYFVPILNPDGFVYSKIQDRFWSKNRKKIDTLIKCENEREPFGVNIARNWFFQKALKKVGEECNVVYIGHRPLSQEENQSISYVLNNLALKMIAFINVRGFGQYITVPYAEKFQDTNNHDIVMEILKSTSFKVREKHNMTFYVGKTSSYFCNMADWVKKKINTPIVYTVNLEDIVTILPVAKNIKKISKQFYTILYESLLVSKDIYGPLFKNQIKVSINILLFYTISIFNLIFLLL